MSSAPVATANKSFLMAHSFLYSRGSTHQRGRRCTCKKISKLLEPGLFSALLGRAERQTRSFKDQRAGAKARCVCSTFTCAKKCKRVRSRHRSPRPRKKRCATGALGLRSKNFHRAHRRVPPPRVTIF